MFNKDLKDRIKFLEERINSLSFANTELEYRVSLLASALDIHWHPPSKGKWVKHETEKAPED